MPDAPGQLNETRDQTFTPANPYHIDTRGLVVGEQVLFPLSKSDFLLLTKVSSSWNPWAQFTLGIVVAKVIEVASKSIQEGRLTVDLSQGLFIAIGVVVAGVLLGIGHYKNPKKRVIKRAEEFFDKHE